jgi:hypothetical protein
MIFGTVETVSPPGYRVTRDGFVRNWLALRRVTVRQLLSRLVTLSTPFFEYNHLSNRYGCS